MPSTTTTNMGLIVPTVGQEPGPAWANDVNADLGILDQHDHTTGRGVPITPSGMSISSDLPFNDNNATSVKTIRFQAQSASLSGVSPNLGCIYVAGNELYYNDEAGNVVQITATGSVNAGAGSITGLPSGTASASFSVSTFTWRSATNTAANMDGGSFVFREVAANAKGVTVSSPTSLAADYGLTWPASLPGAQNFATIDASGNIAAPIALTGGINTANLANSAVTTAKIADANVTKPKLAALGQQLSSSSAAIGLTQNTSYILLNNLTVTITTTGRPVFVAIVSDGDTNTAHGSALQMNGNITAQFGFFRGGTVVAQYVVDPRIQSGGSGAALPFSLPCMFTVDAPAAGTYTYTLQAFTSNGSIAVGLIYCKLIAYEL